MVCLRNLAKTVIRIKEGRTTKSESEAPTIPDPAILIDPENVADIGGLLYLNICRERCAPAVKNRLEYRAMANSKGGTLIHAFSLD